MILFCVMGVLRYSGFMSVFPMELIIYRLSRDGLTPSCPTTSYRVGRFQLQSLECGVGVLGWGRSDRGHGKWAVLPDSPRIQSPH